MVTSGGFDKLPVYEGLGVREVWFWADESARASSRWRTTAPAKLLDDRGAARTLPGFGLAKTRFFADDHEVDLDGRGRALSSGLTDDTAHDTSCVMGDVKEIGAAELRQSLGRIAKRLERDGQPIILKVGRRRVGAIVSMRDFEERFALQEAAGRRAELVEQILSNRRKVSHDADAVLRALRER